MRVGAEDVPFLRDMHIGASSLTDFQAYCLMGLKDRQALFLWQTRHDIHYIERNILPFMEVTTPHRFMRYVDGQTSRLTARTDLGRRYQNTYDVVREYCGYIILEKDTVTGLYDPWQGGGSVFEIQLERDVKLPVKYIRSALPDGGDGYAVESVYGMCGSAWTQGGVKMIHAPLKYAVSA